MNTENSIFLIKPDLVANHKAIDLIIDLINMLHSKNCHITSMKKLHMTKSLVEKFYEEHVTKSFFAEISDYMTSGEIIAIYITGVNAISTVRNILGHTDPKQAEIGTLRQKYGTSLGSNGTHGSDSVAASSREYKLIFNDN